MISSVGAFHRRPAFLHFSVGFYLLHSSFWALKAFARRIGAAMGKRGGGGDSMAKYVVLAVNEMDCFLEWLLVQ